MASKTADPAELERLRAAIDDLDERLLEVLNARIDCARQIGELKASAGAPVFVAPREKQVLRKLLSRNSGPFPNENLLRIYREVFSASRGAEMPIRVAFAGAEGSLCHAAATGMFGRSTPLEAGGSPADALSRLARRQADYAVLPSVAAPEGVEDYALLHILRLELHVVAEFYLPLEVGIALPPRRKAIQRVLVPPAFATLAAERLPVELPDATPVPVADVPTAARTSLEERGSAALVPRFTADEFGLEVRRTLLGAAERRRVRYLVAGRDSPDATGADKTTIAFGLVNRAGNLQRALKPLSKRRINLTLLTTSPAGPFSREDLFFLDFEGHLDEERTRKVLEEMREECSFVEVLGSYPVFDLSSRSR